MYTLRETNFLDTGILCQKWNLRQRSSSKVSTVSKDLRIKGHNDKQNAGFMKPEPHTCFEIEGKTHKTQVTSGLIMRDTLNSRTVHLKSYGFYLLSSTPLVIFYCMMVPNASKWVSKMSKAFIITEGLRTKNRSGYKC